MLFMIDIGRFFERIFHAFETKLKRETVGKAEAKVMGAQSRLQQKALRGVNDAVDGAADTVKGKGKKKKPEIEEET